MPKCASETVHKIDAKCKRNGLTSIHPTKFPLGLSMQQHRVISTTLKPSAPIQLEGPARTRRSLKLFAPRWQFHPSFHQLQLDLN
jgi:hypothetical protein